MDPLGQIPVSGPTRRDVTARRRSRRGSPVGRRCDDSHPVAALQGLARLGDAQATDTLVAGLQDRATEVRDVALGLLKNWRMEPVQERLKGAMAGDDPDAKRRAAIALVFGTLAAAGLSRARFFGKASHAGFAPEAGRSALDAVELMNVAANYMREHMAPGAKLSYAITKTEEVPSIVPAFAESW